MTVIRFTIVRWSPYPFVQQEIVKLSEKGNFSERQHPRIENRRLGLSEK